MIHIVFDAHSFGNGGAERNAKFIAEYFVNADGFKVIVFRGHETQFAIPGTVQYVGRLQWFFGLLAVTKLQLTSRNVVFFSVKSNLPISIFFKLISIRVISRFNNSPESYLYWSGAKPFISAYFKRKGKSSDTKLFNSSYNKYFYNVMPSTKFNGLYLPNVSWLQSVQRAQAENDSRPRFIFLGRIAQEKQVCEGVALLNSIGVQLSEIYIYGSGSQTALVRARYPGVNISDYDLQSIAASDVVISQSLFEGMPNAVIDALAVGAKLLLSINWAHTELFVDCQAHGVTNVSLYNPGDVQTLQYGIRRLGASVDTYKERQQLFSLKADEISRALANLKKALET